MVSPFICLHGRLGNIRYVLFQNSGLPLKQIQCSMRLSLKWPMGQKLALRGKRVSQLSFSPGLTPWLQCLALPSKQLNKKNTLQYFKINNILIFYRLVVGESKYYPFIFGVTLIIVSFWKGPRPCTRKCCNSPVFTALVNMNIQQIQLQP